MPSKKSIAVFTAVILIASAVFAGGAAYAAESGDSSENDFYDIKGHWAENTLRPLIEKGILNGVKVGSTIEARPDTSITRAEFVAILVRAFGFEPVSGNLKEFKDVDGGAWYYDSIQAASSNSLIAGYPDGTFRPEQPIANGHAGIILTNLKNRQAKDTGGSEADEGWFEQELINGLRNKLSGVPESAFLAERNATRAEAMSALYMYLELTGQEGGVAPKPEDKQPVAPAPSTSSKDPASIKSPSGTSQTPAPAEQTADKATDPGVLGYRLTAEPGEIVYFQIYAYALTDLGKFDFKITYDPDKVIATSVKNGAIKATNYVGQSGDVDLSQADSGIVYVRSSDTSPVVQSDGTLFTVVFQVQPEAAGTTEIALASSDGGRPKLYKANGTAISEVTSTNGSIAIK